MKRDYELHFAIAGFVLTASGAVIDNYVNADWSFPVSRVIMAIVIANMVIAPPYFFWRRIKEHHRRKND